MFDRELKPSGPAVDGKPGFVRRLRYHLLRSETFRGYALISPTMGLMILGLSAPVLLLIAMSFWTQQYLDIIHTFTIDNYIAFFKKTAYLRLLGKSIVIPGRSKINGKLNGEYPVSSA